MYERFTDRARKVMQLANQEAQRFNHEYVGTEHILLGLVREGTGTAANVLANLGVDLRKVHQQVELIVQSGPYMTNVQKLPQTPRAKKVIEYAIEEARQLQHSHVGTEHLLLGLLREEKGVGAQVLQLLGLTLNLVRAEVLTHFNSPPPEESDRSTALPEVRQRLQELEALLEHLACAKEEAVLRLEFDKAGRLRDEADALKKERNILLGSRSERRITDGRKTACSEVRAVAQEYDLYLPLRYNDGSPIEPDNLDTLKHRLHEKFGGMTFFPQKNEGTWKINNVTFRDEIVILRILSTDTVESLRFFLRLKEELKQALKQEDILIVARQVRIL